MPFQGLPHSDEDAAVEKVKLVFDKWVPLVRAPRGHGVAQATADEHLGLVRGAGRLREGLFGGETRLQLAPFRPQVEGLCDQFIYGRDRDCHRRESLGPEQDRRIAGQARAPS